MTNITDFLLTVPPFMWYDNSIESTNIQLWKDFAAQYKYLTKLLKEPGTILTTRPNKECFMSFSVKSENLFKLLKHIFKIEEDLVLNAITLNVIKDPNIQISTPSILTRTHIQEEEDVFIVTTHHTIAIPGLDINSLPKDFQKLFDDYLVPSLEKSTTLTVKKSEVENVKQFLKTVEPDLVKDTIYTWLVDTFEKTLNLKDYKESMTKIYAALKA